MGKHKNLVALAIGILSAVGLLTVLPSSATPSNDGVCQPQDQHIAGGDFDSITITAPEGQLISGYCVKAGSANQGNGPEYVTLEPPVAEVTITHSSGKDISHYIVFYVDDPGTTTVPEVTTTVPDEVTTTVPEVTTTVPETTTTLPEVTTTVPEVTTTVPETTTTVPETTTTEPCTGNYETDPSGCPIDDCSLPDGNQPPGECGPPEVDPPDIGTPTGIVQLPRTGSDVTTPAVLLAVLLIALGSLILWRRHNE